MEGVPKLYMLKTTLKTSPERTDFSRKVKWQIREHFNEDPNSYANETRELETLRASACHPPQDFSGCSLLKKYYCQLHFLQNRFTFTEAGKDEVFFTWCDMYTGLAYSTTDIKHEMACVLYNIGALHMNLGAMDSRQTADGMKMSCSHFQCAAWAFQQLNEKYPQQRETDLGYDLVKFFATVSLAQAQECILEKSIIDGRKPGIVAKVAAQIVEYYRSAAKVLDQGDNHPDGNALVEVAGVKIYNTWRKYSEFKMSFHQCVALLYMGIHSEEMQKMGERLAYFQAATDKLTEATKKAKKLDNKPESINDAISFVHDVVGGKLKAAEKENEFVYHEKVPDRASLPEIKGASLVKGTPFDVTDPEIAGQDIFHRLVPMEAHEASSLYSEEKAKLLRRVGGNVEEKDRELALFLTSLQVDQLRVHLEPSSLPQELIDLCAAFSVESNVVQSLIDAMGELSSVYTDVESSLAEVQNLLSEEQENERLYQVQGKRPPSMILKELSLEAGRYVEAHAKAADSNMLLHKAINSHLGNLRTLSLPLSEIQAQLPNIQILESSKDQAAIKELHRLLDKVEEMRKQRQMLYTQLREAFQADDITKLATHQTDLEALFTQELAKHQRVISLIEQNLSAQEKILVALTEANARYADTRRSTAEIQQRRAATVAALMASAEAHPDLIAKCQKGLEFYRKMDTNVTKLLQRLRSVCRVQQEEREQQVAARERNRPLNVSNPRPEIEDSAEHVPSGPKLKDFLHLIKKDRVGVEPTFIPATSSAPPSYAGADAVAPFSYPYQRPTPLGAEQSDRHPQSTPYVPDGNSYYYQNNTSQSGFPFSGPTRPTYNSGTSTIDKSAAFTAIQPGASRAQPSYNYPSPSASPLHQQHTPAVNPHPIPTSQPQQPSYPTAEGQTYLGQQSLGGRNSIPTFAANLQMQPQNYPPSSNYYGLGTIPYSAPTLLMQQQAYPTASQMGQHPTATVPVTTTSTSSATNYPAASYITPNGVTSSSSYVPHLVTQQQPTSVAPSSFTQTMVSQQQTGYGGTSYLNQPSSGRENQSGPLSYQNTNISIPPTQQQQQQQQYPYYPGGPMYGYPPTTTAAVVASMQQHPFGYNSSNSNMDGSGGYQHGVTGTNNSALSQSAGHQGPGLITAASASGIGQYQHYPYYPNPVDPANTNYQYQLPGSYYPVANSYRPTAEQNLQPPLAPTPVPPAPTVAQAPVVNLPATLPSSNTTAVQVASNLELLTLLDLSVPMAPIGGLLEPQSKEAQTPGGNTQGTTTLTNSTIKSVLMATTITPDSIKLSPISCATESSPLHESSSKSEVKLPTLPSCGGHKDPLDDTELASKLAIEVEKLNKLVDGLTRKSLNGPTSLDTRWKEVLELQERESTRHSISVARCYPMKNRLPDVLPYDHNRVELPTTKDDYINASLVPALSPGAPSFIATQTPLPCSQQDFWTMIWQQSVEIVVCLLSDAEIPKPSPSTSAIYWPVEKGRDITSGPWTITLQSSNIRSYCHERILGLSKNGEAKQRVVIHLQFTAWPGNSFPASPAQFLQLTSEVLHFWQQQRSKTHPIVVHCLAGAGRTGLFCLLSTALYDLTSGHGLLDMVRVAASLCQHRRNMFRDREHLLFAYQALLYHAQDLLMKRGILSGTTSLQGSPVKKHHPSQDFIHSPIQTPSINATPVLDAAANVLKETTERENVVSQLTEEPTTVLEAKETTLAAKKSQALGALAILDPANFTLDGGQTNRHRVTKESFKNASQLGTVSDPSDPLSQLDPLWSLAK